MPIRKHAPSRQETELRSYLLLTLHSKDLEADGRVRYSPAENLWVAAIARTAIREAETVGSKRTRQTRGRDRLPV